MKFVLFSWSALRRLRGCEVQSSELDEILQEQAEAKGMRSSRPWELFTDRSVRWQLISVMVISSAMQLCGNDSVRRAAPVLLSDRFLQCVHWKYLYVTHEDHCYCSGATATVSDVALVLCSVRRLIRNLRCSISGLCLVGFFYVPAGHINNVRWCWHRFL